MSLWNSSKLIKKLSPHICTQTKMFIRQRASFCTREKASLTIEASIVVPLMIGFLSVFLFCFRIIQVQSKVEEALMYAGRNLAVESSSVSSEALLLASGETVFVSMLNDTIAPIYIKNGIWGISLLKSDFKGENIVLRADYEMLLPVNFFGIDSITLSSESKCRKWVGDVASSANGEWVYITEKGVVYHTDISCRVLDIKPQAAPYDEIANYRGNDGQRFYRCGRCIREDTGVVFYTDYGRLYHTNINCSALKRTIQKILISEIGGRRACKFCQE